MTSRPLVGLQQLRSLLGVAFRKVREVFFGDLLLILLEPRIRLGVGDVFSPPVERRRDCREVARDPDGRSIGRVPAGAREIVQITLKLVGAGCTPAVRRSGYLAPRRDWPVPWEWCRVSIDCCTARTGRGRIPAGRGRSSRPPAPPREPPPRPRNRASPRVVIASSASRTILVPLVPRPAKSPAAARLPTQTNRHCDSHSLGENRRGFADGQGDPRLAWIDCRDEGMLIRNPRLRMRYCNL